MENNENSNRKNAGKNKLNADLDEQAAWRRLFGGRTEIEIAMIINDFWLDPAYKIIVLKSGEINAKAGGSFFLKEIFPKSNNNKNQSNHHRRPRSIGGKNGGKNAILVDRNDHNAWHKLFRNFMPDKIAEIINKKWLDPNSDYLFKIIRLTDVKDGNGADKKFLFYCEVCGKSYFNEIEARKCRKKGWLAPRFARGERVLIKIRGYQPQIGVIADWDNSFSINFHFFEMYAVETENTAIDVDARNIKYVLKDNGRKERRKKYVVFSKKIFKKIKKRKGF